SPRLIALFRFLNSTLPCAQEFEDHFEDEADFTPPAEDTPSMQSPAEVYTLAVPTVPLPGPPHLQLPRITDVSSGPHVARHSLSYIQEIGNGWFGKVLLSEIYAEPGVARVIVKELKANAGSREQNEFLQQGDPYRVLQHPNILQCLGQGVEAIPFLLVFEFCELGDLKSYVSQHEWLYRNGELLQLQKMACEIAAGITHMHKQHFLHRPQCLRSPLPLPVFSGTAELSRVFCHAQRACALMHAQNKLKGVRLQAPLDYGVLAALGHWEMMILWFESKRIPSYGARGRETTPNEVWRCCLIVPHGERGSTKFLDIAKQVFGMTLKVCWVMQSFQSDLALRNCFLTTDLTVKVGDYGIGPTIFKEDYITTEDEQCVALRWLAPELIGELHGGVIASEQTKPSNVWALGVTLWELFECAKQPYPHLSDREVLHHVLKDQQVRLLKPQLDLPYSERWYEVLQFCWLPADKRATAEEVHRLLTYLRMQGQKDVEDDFEQRWTSLKPNPTTRQSTVSHTSFPILEQFDEGREPDEVLTITETSRGLNFEYVWEAAKHDHYDSHTRSTMDTTLNYHSMFFAVPRQDETHFPDTAVPTESNRVPENLPVFDANKASSGNGYFIQLEELDESEIGMEDSRGAEGTNDSEKHRYVALQDVRLDESSTDADFFHQSIDSKDSFLQDSHIWSSSEHDSPYHDIFTKGDGKLEDSHSFTGGFLELPEMNATKTDFEANGREASECFQRSFLGVGPESVHLEISDQESSDVLKLLNTEKLTDNFLFLKDKSLMKDRSPISTPDPKDAQESIVDTDISLNLTGESLNSLDDSSQLMEEYLDLVSPILDDFLSPLKGSETLVPFDDLVPGDTRSNHLPGANGSLCSPKSGNFSSSESTSESVEFIRNSPSDSQQSLESATIDTLHMCTGAKSPSLDHCFKDSNDSRQFQETSGTPVPSFISYTEGSLTEGLTSSDSMSDIVESDRKTAKDMPSSEANDQETLLSTQLSQEVSSRRFSDPCHDQISQDSFLDDITSSTQPTTENFAETPDSLDSLDISRDVVHRGSLENPANKLQPPYKAADSGYETENLESPEWNSQTDLRESPEDSELDSIVVPNPLVPPEIVVSVVDIVPDVQVNGIGVDHQQGPGEFPFGGNYRDSAYFSDNEEQDKKSDNVGVAGSEEASFWSQNNQDAAEAVIEHSPSETSSESAGLTLESTETDLTAAKTVVHELVLSTDDDQNKEETISDDGSDQIQRSHDILEHETTPDTSPDVMVHAKLTRTYAGEGTKRKEPDMEGRFLGKLDGSTLEYGSEDGVDADEEDENSDESDEEMRAYRLHSSSSECSDDEVVHPVPIIISDNSGSLNLRSLLKPQTLQTEKATLEVAGKGEKRRGVSFFDDVTVFLFDQETPTKELGEHTLDPSSHFSEFSSPVASSSYLNKFTNSESSTDEEGGAFEWDDDFPSPEPSFLSKASSGHSASRSCGASAASKYFSPPPANRAADQSWNSSSSYSRFSISPASIASFSLTHLTDSDIEQGGSGEDGEKD
ncbi:hypothetical protein DNTS_007128, partial [Danionella cerebrum]